MARVLTWPLFGFQLVQGMWPLAADPLSRSYWAIDYSQGFIRRGLGGAMVDLLPGPVSHAQVTGVVWVTALAALAAVAWLIVRLQRGGHEALALLLAASPFTIDQLAQNRRPDEWGIVVLVLVGMVVAARWEGRRWWTSLAGLAVAQAALVLMHETTLLLIGVWVFPLLMSRADMSWSQRWASAGVYAVPSVAALAALILWGQATAGQVAALSERAIAQGVLAPAEVDGSILWFLAQTPTESMAMVSGFGVTRIAMVVVWAVLMVAVHAVWVRRITLAWWTLIPVAIGTLAVFVTSLDWPRWSTMAGMCWLVTVSAVSLTRPARRGEAWMLAVGVYLATRAALLPNATPDTWVDWVQWWFS